MDEKSLLIIPIILVVTSLFMLKKLNKVEPIYSVFFTIGTIFIVGGFAKENMPMEILGMALLGMLFMIIGLANKSKLTSIGKDKISARKEWTKSEQDLWIFNLIKMVIGSAFLFFLFISWFLKVSS